jgi:hypothetical protein
MRPFMAFSFAYLSPADLVLHELKLVLVDVAATELAVNVIWNMLPTQLSVVDVLARRELDVDRHDVLAGFDESGRAMPTFVSVDFTVSVEAEERRVEGVALPSELVVLVEALGLAGDRVDGAIVWSRQLEELGRVHMHEDVASIVPGDLVVEIAEVETFVGVRLEDEGTSDEEH